MTSIQINSHRDHSLLLDLILSTELDCKLALSFNDEKNHQALHAKQFLEKYKRPIKELKQKAWKLSDFKVVKNLATGAHGEVYLVEKKGSKNEIYAMKRIHKSQVYCNPESGFYFEERDVMRFGSQSPWITALFTSFQDAYYLYLVMEYMSGGDLLSYILSQPSERLSESEAKFYLAEILLALEDLHKFNYVHRDLKPDNILLDSHGHIKLADFGACFRLDPDTRVVHSNIPVGTPEYISPEVLQAREDGMAYGEECDWWSLGVLLFEMLFGQSPFHHESLTKTYGSIINHKKSFRLPGDSSISKDAKEIISKLICDKGQRLGRTGIQEIKSHPFFNDIDWDHIRSTTPPFLPQPDLSKMTQETVYIESDPKEADKQFYGYHLRFVGYTLPNETEAVKSMSLDMVQLNEKIQLLETEKALLIASHIKDQTSYSIEMTKILEKLSHTHKGLEDAKGLHLQLEDQISKLEAESRDLDSQIKASHMEKEMTNLRFKEAQDIKEEQILKQVEMVKELNQQIVSKNDEAKHLKATVEELIRSNELLRSIIKDKEMIETGLKNDLGALKTAQDSDKQSIGCLKRELTTLELEKSAILADSEKEIKEYKQKLVNANDRYIEKENELNKKYTTHIDAIENKIGKLESELLIQKEKNDLDKIKIQSLVKKLEEMCKPPSSASFNASKKSNNDQGSTNQQATQLLHLEIQQLKSRLEVESKDKLKLKKELAVTKKERDELSFKVIMSNTMMAQTGKENPLFL